MCPQPGRERGSFLWGGQGHKLCWHMCGFWLPAVAKGFVSAPGLDLANIASLVPSTFCHFSVCFAAGRKRSNNQNCSVFSLISSTTRTSSFPTMPSKVTVFRWCCRETPFFPWRRNTTREAAADLQCSSNSGQDFSLLQMSTLRLVLVVLGAQVVRDITSVRVPWEKSLELPMNNLFGLTTTDCHSIVCWTWSSALSHSLPLSLYGLLQLYSAAKPMEKDNKPMGIFSILSRGVHSAK